jgi:DNA-binding MarR family transcriptional regulator
MDARDIQLTDRVGFLLQKAGTLFLQSVGEQLAAAGINTRQYMVLAGVESAAPVSQQDLSRLLGIDPTVMVALVDELERGSLVTRARDQRDRRRYALALTPDGERALARAHAAMTGAEQEFFAPLSEAQQQRLRASLKRLLAGRWP